MLISGMLLLVRFLQPIVTFAKLAGLYTEVTLARRLPEAKYLFCLEAIRLMAGARRNLPVYVFAQPRNSFLKRSCSRHLLFWK